MKAELRDNHSQVEHIEVSDPPPTKIIRAERVGGSINNKPELLPNHPVEFIYSIYRVINGIAVYHFYAANKKA